MQQIMMITARASSAPSVYPTVWTAFFTLVTTSGVRISKILPPGGKKGWNSLLMSKSFPSRNLKKTGQADAHRVATF